MRPQADTIRAYVINSQQKHTFFETHRIFFLNNKFVYVRITNKKSKRGKINGIYFFRTF